MIPVSDENGLSKGLLLELEKVYPEEAKLRKKQSKEANQDNSKSTTNSFNNASQ